MDDVLALYAGAPTATRAFLKGRVLLSDLEFIERQVPAGGAVLDLGCGHGLFANLMALRAPGRHVTGIDLSAGKIETALNTVGDRTNIDFIHGDMLDLGIPATGLPETDSSATGLPEYDVITIVDVLYLMTPDEQRRLLVECRRRLRDGGLLVWKAQERRPRWKFAWTYLQEFIATSAGLTHGRRGRLAFMSREEALAALRAAGFKPRIVAMKSRRPYTDILYLGT